MKNFQFSIFNFQILLLILVMPMIVSGATAVVEVDTGTETINALEGTLVLPVNVEVKDIYTGNSAILIWVTSPKLDGNTITFAGITPGGFRGKYPIFSLDASSIAGFSFNNIKAYKNDGSGESISVKLSLRETEIAEDTAPPEPFKPLISSSPDLFDGRRFVSFAAQDKGTGIKRYEYAPVWLLPPGQDDWREAESPLALSRPMLFQKIYIRAVDHAGNERTVSTAGPYYYYSLAFGVIILLCVFLLSRRSFRSRS